MPRLPAAILAMTFAPAAAQASSLVTVEPPGAGNAPSIVRLGEPGAPAFVASAIAADEDGPQVIEAPDVFAISPSVIAFGIAAIPAGEEDTASDESWRDEPAPQVIRGGLVGSAFATPEPAAEAEADALDVPPEEAVQEPRPAQEPVEESE